MTLAGAQRDFLTMVLDDDARAPPGWTERTNAGMTIYRNAYRSRLVDALGETFPAVRAWVGDDSFARAAAHHAIAHPPTGWSLDLVGIGFPDILQTLFANDPEVAELAWLEWQMHLAFVAHDDRPLDREGLARTIEETDPDKIGALALIAVAGTAVRPVDHDITAIWRAMTQGGASPEKYSLDERGVLVVWRKGLNPVFRIATADEAACLALAAESATFGTICKALSERIGNAGMAAAKAGAMLACWVEDGVLAELRL